MLESIQASQQSVVDYGSATITQRVSESAGKLASTGQIENFSQLSNKVGLEQANGTTAITDAATGEQIIRFPTVTITGGYDRGETDAKTTNDFKVTITSMGFGSVVFDVMPSIDEGQSAEYVEFTPLHHPGSILKYRKTNARTWSISAKLIARNATEANNNLNTINIIRGWLMPQYGERTAATPGMVPGAPPPILTLSAYGNRVIGPVKCVLDNFRWTFANDVDYLPTVDINVPDPDSARAPFPAIIDVSLSLKESWSPAEFSSFDLNAYINGRLTGQNGAFFAQRVQARSQRNVLPAPVAPSSMDNYIAGRNTLRRFENSEPRSITPVQIMKSYNPNATTEGAAMATDIGDFASNNGIMG